MKLSIGSLAISAVIVLVALLALVVPACQFAPNLAGPLCPVAFQLGGLFGYVLGFLSSAFYLLSGLSGGVLSSAVAQYALAAVVVVVFALSCWRLGWGSLWIAALFILVLPFIFPSVFVGLLVVLFAWAPQLLFWACPGEITAACLRANFGSLYVAFALFPSAVVFKLAGARAKQLQLKEAKFALRTIGGATGKATSQVKSAISEGTDPTGLVKKLPGVGDEGIVDQAVEGAGPAVKEEREG